MVAVARREYQPYGSRMDQPRHDSTIPPDPLVGLLGRCAGGDAGALRELYAAAAPQLYAVVLRILRRNELAEEALQEAFLQIWTKAASYRVEKGRPLAWMVTIARYRALDMARRGSLERLIPDGDEVIALLADPGDGPVADANLRSDRRALRGCLDELPRQQQQSIRLAFVDGCTHGEIATVVQAPLGSVKSWVRRGLIALRGCLERRGTVPP